jgi:hypothetical protein
MLVQERGIDFEPTDDYLQEVRLAGGEDELISALKGAKVTKPTTVDPAVQARQAEILRHVARGGEFWRNTRYADAEAERVAQSLGFQRLCGFSGVPSMFDSLEVKVLYPT